MAWSSFAAGIGVGIMLLIASWLVAVSLALRRDGLSFRQAVIGQQLRPAETRDLAQAILDAQRHAEERPEDN